MQTHGGAPAATAIEGSERVFHAELTVDWNKDGRYTHPLSDLSSFISSATTDRSLRGSAPEAVLLIEGASAAELVVTLHGDYQGLSFAGIFSPYQQRSPFFQTNIIGAEITYRLGVQTSAGVVWYPQFVGNIRTITPNRADGTVEITALDRVETLRRPVQLPPWAISEFHQSRGVIQAQLCNTQWVIDHCLRQSDTSPTPYRPADLDTEVQSPRFGHDGRQLWVSGTGSYLPTIGWVDSGENQQFPLTESTGTPMFDRSGSVHPASPNPEVAPLALTANADDAGQSLRYWIADRGAVAIGDTHVFGFTLITRGRNGSYYKTAGTQDVMTVRVGFNHVVRIRIGAGKVWTDRVDPRGGIVSSTQFNLPVTGDYVRIWAAWQFGNTFDGSGNTQCFIKVGSGGSAVWQIVGPAVTTPLPLEDNYGLVTLTHNVGIQDAFYSGLNNGGDGSTPYDVLTDTRPTGVPAKYVAVLDEGLNRFSFMPTKKSDDAWQIITEAAGAEFGSVFWDETGMFRFWNYQRILDLQDTLVRTLTLDELTGLKITNSLDSVRNIWSVEAKRRQAVIGSVFQATSVDQFYVAGGDVARFTIWMDDVMSVNTADPTRYTSTAGHPTLPRWTDDVQHGYVIQWLIGGVWQEADARTVGFTNFISQFDASGFLFLEVGNAWPEPVRLARNGGQPALRLSGNRIADFPALTFSHRDQTSVDEYGPRNLPLTGNWVQDQYNAAQMIDTLMPRTVRPAPTTDAITIAGDPRLQLGDTIGIRDEDGFGQLAAVQTYGIRREYNRDGGLTDTLTVELTRRRIVFENATNVDIPDKGPAVTSTITVSGIPGIPSSVVRVGVDIKHSYRGDLEIDLIASGGRTFRLKNSDSTNSEDNVITTYTVNASSSPASGAWQLRVRDVFQDDTGFIDSWRLTFLV